MEITSYKTLLDDIKLAIRKAQIRATFAVNTEMILLYWETGKMIAERQSQKGWSAKVIPNLAKD